MKNFGIILSTLAFITATQAQNITTPINQFPKSDRIIPYQTPHKYNKISRVGNYPKIKNTKPWDGRMDGEYHLRFKINGLKTGETVFLADHHIGGKYLRDTAVVDKKGVAEFTGNKLLQRGMYLFVLPGKSDFYEFIIDDDQDFTIKTDISYYEHDYYKNLKVEG